MTKWLVHFNIKCCDQDWRRKKRRFGAKSPANTEKTPRRKLEHNEVRMEEGCWCVFCFKSYIKTGNIWRKGISLVISLRIVIFLGACYQETHASSFIIRFSTWTTPLMTPEVLEKRTVHRYIKLKQVNKHRPIWHKMVCNLVFEGAINIHVISNIFYFWLCFLRSRVHVFYLNRVLASQQKLNAFVSFQSVCSVST